MLIKIVEVKKKPFTGSEGESVDFYWSKGVRQKDEVVIQFGGMIDYTNAIGTIVELPIEKRELSNGKFGYRDTSRPQGT